MGGSFNFSWLTSAHFKSLWCVVSYFCSVFWWLISSAVFCYVLILYLWHVSPLFPLQCELLKLFRKFVFPCVCCQFVLLPVWRVNISRPNNSHFHVVYSFCARCVKAFTQAAASHRSELETNPPISPGTHCVHMKTSWMAAQKKVPHIISVVTSSV